MNCLGANLYALLVSLWRGLYVKLCYAEGKRMNLLEIIGTDTELKRTSGTHGGEYHGPCPFCGGKDRFWAQPAFGENGRWKCRQCDKGGDAYDYVMEKRGLGFREAKSVVDGVPIDDGTQRKVDMDRVPENRDVVEKSNSCKKRNRSNSSRILSSSREPARLSDSPAWQSTVKQFVDRSWKAGIGRTIANIEYLLGRSRAFSRRDQCEAKLGYCPKAFAWKGVDFYEGLVIPAFNSAGDLDYCKVRLGPGKYVHIKGGNGSAVYGLRDLPLDPVNGIGWSGR